MAKNKVESNCEFRKKLRFAHGYTILDNDIVLERYGHLSLSAKGLLWTLLSLPDDWSFSINGISKITQEKPRTIQRRLDELKTAGYIRVEKLFPNQTSNGRYKYIYTISDMPEFKSK